MVCCCTCGIGQAICYEDGNDVRLQLRSDTVKLDELPCLRRVWLPDRRVSSEFRRRVIVFNKRLRPAKEVTSVLRMDEVLPTDFGYPSGDNVVNTRSGDTPLHGWNRPAGRPRATWTSQIVRDTGLTAADTWTVADDRSTWRALRPIAGYAQQ